MTKWFVRLLLVPVLILTACSDQGGSHDNPREAIDEPAVDEPLPEGFARYTNKRYRYTVDYPDTLLEPLGESHNADGQRFVSNDSNVVLTAFGRHVEASDSLSQLFDLSIDRHRRKRGVVLYSSTGDSAFVISGTSDNHIYYEKTVLFEDRLARIELTYPISMRTAMDSVVTRVSHSFGGRVN